MKLNPRQVETASQRISHTSWLMAVGFIYLLTQMVLGTGA